MYYTEAYTYHGKYPTNNAMYIVQELHTLIKNKIKRIFTINIYYMSNALIIPLLLLNDILSIFSKFGSKFLILYNTSHLYIS